MAHEKVYGICENKCQHEVYRKEDADNAFLKKTTASSSYAIKNHATNQMTYGIATSSLYGHVQIKTDLNIPEQATSGIALAGSVGKTLNDKITALESRVETLESSVIYLNQQVGDLRQRVEALENAE